MIGFYRWYKRMFFGKKKEENKSGEMTSKEMLTRLTEINKTHNYNALCEFAREIGAHIPMDHQKRGRTLVS